MYTDILINATTYENRIAHIENGCLREFYIDRPTLALIENDIYLGKIGAIIS